MTTLLRIFFLLSLLFISGNSQLLPFIPRLLDPLNLFGTRQQQQNENHDNAEITEQKIQAEFRGKWELFTENSGVSAMHLILLPKINKVLMFDSTIWRISNVQLPPPCHSFVEDNQIVQDCYAHSVLLDIESGALTPLRLEFDTWCSSGALAVDGTLVSTGGFRNGSDTARYLRPCDTCGWSEYPKTLANGRWYSTQVTLGDGRFMVFGGRDSPTYEFLPAEGQSNKEPVFFQFLVDTKDNVENNLYPFVYLSTDGNLFIFANDRAVLLDPNTNQIVRQFPVLPGGSRSYPASGSSALLPIVLLPDDERKDISAQVIICGGARKDAFLWADLRRPKKFFPANADCGRISITKNNPKWRVERMPSPRILGDAIILPTGDVLLINGAKSGSAGWDDARDPNFVPVMYRYRAPANARFRELEPSTIPRMYHSTSALLPDARVLISGSNTNNGYQYDALFPTELRVEKFSPPYLDHSKSKYRLEIMEAFSTQNLYYKQRFLVQVRSSDFQPLSNKLQVTMYSPPFTTHGISMNQRLLQLGIVEVNNNVLPGVHNIVLSAPPNGNIAPPGYYMLFVNHNGVPSVAMWVQIQ